MVTYTTYSLGYYGNAPVTVVNPAPTASQFTPMTSGNVTTVLSNPTNPGPASAQKGSPVGNETPGEKAAVGSNPSTLQVQETQGKPPNYDDVTASATTQSPEGGASSKNYQRLVSID